MNIEKATYLNTLQQPESGRNGRVVSAYGAGQTSGGVRFHVRGRGAVRLIAEYRTIGERATLKLDGAPIAVTLRPYTEILLRLDKGEHLFEATSPSGHGGLTLIAEGTVVSEAGPYLDRVGGCVTPSGCVVYLKKGDGALEQCVYDGSSVTRSARTELFYDEAYLYDVSQSEYTATKRSVYGTSTGFTVNVGVSTTFSYLNIRGLAMCDKRTLSAGADYLVAFADRNSSLRFVRVEDGTGVPSANVSESIGEARRVVSAARGSIFLAERPDRVWTAYWFHPQGERTLAFSGNSQPYDVIEIGRTGGSVPSATVDESGAPILYYRKEDGRLMCLEGEELPRRVAYAEAYQPTLSGGLLQVEGELAPYQL